MTRASLGFTLLELMLALTLTATLMVSSVAAVNLFVAADKSAIEGYEFGVDVSRALRQVREDIEHAASISIGVRTLSITRTDGRCVAYAIPATSLEVHRFTGNNAVTVDAAAAAALLAVRSIDRDGRGLLRDTSWSDTAILQGTFTWTMTAIKSPLDGTVVGLQVVITYPVDAERRRQSTTATSFALVEASCKPTKSPSGGAAAAAAAAPAAGK